MRVYNGTKSQLDLPLTNIQRIQISSRSVSGDILPNTEFLSLLVSSYNYDEIALIVSGPYEINMCSQVSGAVGFVVGSLEEAIERFTPKTADIKPVPTTPEKVEEKVKPEEPKEEIPVEEAPKVEEPEEVKEETPEVAPEVSPEVPVEEPKAEEDVKEEKPAKKLRKKVKK